MWNKLGTLEGYWWVPSFKRRLEIKREKYRSSQPLKPRFEKHSKSIKPKTPNNACEQYIIFIYSIPTYIITQ